MVNSVVVEVLGGDGLLNDVFKNLLAELLGGNVGRVLGRHNHGVHTDGDNGAVVVLVLNSDLGLGIGAQPGERAVTAGSRHGSVELVGELEGEGEELRGLVSGITEHDTLVTSTELLEGLLVMQALGDIGRLLLNGNKQVEGLVVETLLRVVIANISDGVADNLLVVELGLGGDFAKDHDHTSLGGGLASDLGQGILGQAGIENSIRDLVSDLVGVTLTDRLGL